MPLVSDIDKQKYRLLHPVVSNDVKNAKKNVTLLNSVFKRLKNNLFPYRDTVFSLSKDGTILSGFDYIGNVNKILLRFDIRVKYKRNLISIDYTPYIIENGNQRYYSEISSEITSDDFEMENGKEPDIFLSQGDMTDKEYKDFLKEDFTLFSNSILSIVESKYKETIKLLNKVESNMRELNRDRKFESSGSKLSLREVHEDMKYQYASIVESMSELFHLISPDNKKIISELRYLEHILDELFRDIKLLDNYID